VDAAGDGDIIKVAAGTYTDVHRRAGITQVVYISKTVTVRGGYTITNWTVSEPAINTTILDAKGLGRVIFITGTITPTIEGLHIVGGDATGIGNQGGGICSVRANPVIAGNVISGNVAGTAGYARGGGICLEGGTPSALITGNHVLHNVATTSAPDSGHGGGIYLNASAATVYSNTIQDNIANPNGWGVGGGIYLYASTAIVEMNTVVSNTASGGHRGFGGGIMLYNSIYGFA